MNKEELEKSIAAKRAAKTTELELRIEAHNLAFLEAYEKALDGEFANRLVIVDIPKVGKCLYRFAGRTDHAAFTREIHEKIELAPCVTYTSKCVLYPLPVAHRELLDKENPEGFVKAALAIKTAMKGEDTAEGKD